MNLATLFSHDVGGGGRRRISSAPPRSASGSRGDAPALAMSSRIVCRIADALGARGLDGLGACRKVGIAPEIVRDVDALVDADAYMALWGEAVALAEDPWLPLDVARHATDTPNLLRFVCMTSATLGEGLERASRFLSLVTNTVAWRLVRDVDGARLVSERSRDPHPHDLYADLFFVAENVTLDRIATGIPSLSPREVRFAHPEPADTTPLRVFLRAPVVWDAERTEIVFERRALDLPLVHADPPAVAFFEAYAAKLLRDRASLPPVTDEVKRSIASLLRGRTPTLDEVATELGTSARTLRRRLEGEGTSFQQLLDGHRQELAAKLVLEGTSSLEEIALLLGFADVTSFHRAFRRWHGAPPQRYAHEERLRRAREGV